jgi:hypothetical protein
MLPTGTRAPASAREPAAPGCSIRDGGARARHHQGEGTAARHVVPADQRARGDGADQLSERGPDGEVAEVAVLFVRRGLTRDQRLGADDEAQMAEAHDAAPQGHRPQGTGDAAERAAAGDEDHADGQQRRAAAVVGAAAERDGGEQRQQRVDTGDDADRPLVRAQRQGTVGDGGPGHRHRPLGEAEGDDEAEQPAAVPTGRHGRFLPGPPVPRSDDQMMPNRMPAARMTRLVRTAHFTTNFVWSPNSTLAMPTRT